MLLLLLKNAAQRMLPLLLKTQPRECSLSCWKCSRENAPSLAENAAQGRFLPCWKNAAQGCFLPCWKTQVSKMLPPFMAGNAANLLLHKPKIPPRSSRLVLWYHVKVCNGSVKSMAQREREREREKERKREREREKKGVLNYMKNIYKNEIPARVQYTCTGK